MNKLCCSFLVLFTFFSLANAQEQDSLFIKLKEQQNEKQFYNSIFRNPALMSDFRKYKLSSIELRYQQNTNQFYQIQKPEQENNFGVEVSSFYPLKKGLTLWGSASYQNIDKKNIVWNESIDYKILYPYFTADELGGNLKQENYSFLGGLSKKAKKIDWGSTINYQAKLASRSKDPRPQDISSNLKIGTGLKIKAIFGLDAGLNVGVQKYSQSNEILFFNKTNVVSIYHLNGLGNYNYLLKGNKTDAFYDAWGYAGGLQIFNSKQKNLFLVFNLDVLNIDKIIRLNTNVEASKLTNKNIEASVIKIFDKNQKHKYGVKLNFTQNTKKGVESIFSGRSSAYEIISRIDNFSLERNLFQLSAMYYSPQNNLYFSPYINYIEYKENNINPIGYQSFDYLAFGFDAKYLFKFYKLNTMQLQLNSQYQNTLKNEALFSVKGEEAINNMLEKNYLLLSKSFLKSDMNVQFNYKINALEVFTKLVGEVYFINKKTNTIFSVSSGINF